MNNRAFQIQNALRLIQFELDAMNQQHINIQGYLSPVANEIIMSNTVQPYYKKKPGVVYLNTLQKCIDVALKDREC